MLEVVYKEYKHGDIIDGIILAHGYYGNSNELLINTMKAEHMKIFTKVPSTKGIYYLAGR